MKNILSYISLFLLLFDLDMPFLRGVGSSIYSLMINILCMIIFSYQLKSKVRDILQEFLWVSLLIFILVYYAAIRILFDGGSDLSYLGTSIKALVILLATLTFLMSFDSNQLAEKLFNVFFINACIALFVGSHQEYQIFVDIFKPNGGMELIGSIPYRNAFLAGAGYFGIGAPYGLASAFFIVYFLSEKSFSLISLAKVLIILIAAIFAARTVFICIALIGVYLILDRKIKLFLLSTTVVIAIFMLLNVDIFSNYHSWLFEMFNKGISNTASGNALLNDHQLILDNPITLLFGDGKYSTDTGGYYGATDIGFWRHLYFGGVFFMFAVISIPLLLYFKNRSKIFILLLYPISLLLHFKGVFIYNNPAFIPLTFLISHILYKDRIAK